MEGRGTTHRAQWRSRSCRARLDHPTTCRGVLLLSCGDLEGNPGPPATYWGEGDNAVVPELVSEACGRLGISPVRDAFATPANHRFPAYWTREDDAFAQSWDGATAGPLWANSPFSRLEEVVAKAAREGCLMLIIAPEWPGPQYPWWTALCALCPRRWQLPLDRPLYLRGGTDLMPAHRRRTWCWTLGRVLRRRRPRPPPHSAAGPPITGGNPGRGPGRTTHDGPPPHGHACSSESALEGGAQK